MRKSEIAVRAVMFYLRAYLQADAARAKRLKGFAAKSQLKITGSTLWRQLTLRVNPTPEFFLIYLAFLHREGAIVSGKTKRSGLFTYTLPALLRRKIG